MNQSRQVLKLTCDIWRSLRRQQQTSPVSKLMLLFMTLIPLMCICKIAPDVNCFQLTNAASQHFCILPSDRLRWLLVLRFITQYKKTGVGSEKRKHRLTPFMRYMFTYECPLKSLFPCANNRLTEGGLKIKKILH